MKQINFYLIGLLIASSVSISCFADNSTRSKPEVIDLQLRWHHQFQFAGYYAAKAKGYYRQEGLEVRIHEASSSKTPVEEVLSGNAQYGQSNSDILYARLQGKPVVVLAAIFQHSPLVLLTLKSSEIYTPHDLIGKKVMLLNPQADAYFHAMLRNEGIEANLVDLVHSSLNFEDLINNQVQVFNSYLTNEPFILNQRGIEYNVINPTFYGSDFYSDILFTTEHEIKKHPERVQAMLRATLKGWRYAMDHPDEIINLLIEQYKVPKSREHLQYEAKTMRPFILPDLIEIGHMNPGRWERMAKAYIDIGIGIGNKDISLDEFIYDPHPRNQVEHLKKTLVIVTVVSGITLLMAAIMFFGWIRLKREVERRKKAEAQVKQLAYYDSLTAIPNRNSFMPYAKKQIHVAARNRQKLALCFIDLNRFKDINDTYGHKAGDAMLIHVAKSITSVIRESDMAARLGGDEFVVLLTDIQDIENTRRTTREIRRAIATPITFDGHRISLTASIGIAIYPDDGEQIDELISEADTSMFAEKKIN